jgi:putative acetyltransferase
MASFSLRPARLADALAIAGVHRMAVRSLAGGPYSRDVLDRWAPPVSLTRAERLFRDEQDEGAETLVAVAGNEIVGFGIVAPHDHELRACYVAPAASGNGIGRALVTALEGSARAAKCSELTVRASLNSVKFYAALGYAETQRAVFRFDDGVEMPVVLMRKAL